MGIACVRVSIGLIVITLLLISSPADAALNGYMTVIGAQQGPIEGGVVEAGREGTFEINEFHHLITGSRDGVEHQPLIVTTLLGKGIPPLLQALRDGEILDVTIDIYRPGQSGQEQNFYRFELQNARLVIAEPISPDNRRTELAVLPTRIRLRFEFEAIVHRALLADEMVEL